MDGTFSFSDMESKMELPEPVDEEVIEILEKPLFGTTTSYYYPGESSQLLEAIPGSIITNVFTPYDTKMQDSLTRLLNYVNGSPGASSESYASMHESVTDAVFFLNLGNFSAGGTIDGGSAQNPSGITDEEKGKVNQLIQQLGDLGYLQLYCTHINTPALGEDGRNNAIHGMEETGPIAIRILDDQHDANGGHFVLGIYTACCLPCF